MMRTRTGMLSVPQLVHTAAVASTLVSRSTNHGIEKRPDILDVYRQTRPGPVAYEEVGQRRLAYASMQKVPYLRSP